MKKCVLFDFDGVIADTETRNCDYVAETFLRLGVVVTEEEKRSLIGTHDASLYLPMLARANPPLTFEAYRREHALTPTPYEQGPLEPAPGVVALILALREAGYLTGIVSSTASRLILAALNRLHMTALFDVILCGDMTKKHKPDPFPYSMAMELLGVSPENAYVIEDSPSGIRAGLASGATVIAYTGGSISQDVSQASLRAASFDICKEMILNAKP